MSDASASNWLRHVPVPLFASVMGLTGLGLAWRKAHQVLGVPSIIGEALVGLAAVFFVAIAILYIAKIIRWPRDAKNEANHPVRCNFVPAVTISLLLLSIAAFPHHQGLANGLFLIGAFAHLGLALHLLGRWIFHEQHINHMNPAWFIPVVGNIVVPIAGMKLGYGELSWFFFSTGVVLWLVLFATVFNRIIFHDPLPGRLVPTLFILLAPPAVGFVAYAELTHEAMASGGVDTMGRILYYFALMTGLMLATMIRRFIAVSFALSWWAFTFPLAALAIASLIYAHAVPAMPGLIWIAWVALGVASVVVALVLARTLLELVKGRLFVPE